MTQATNKASLIKMYLEYSVDAVFSYNYISSCCSYLYDSILGSERYPPISWDRKHTPLLWLFKPIPEFSCTIINTSCISAVLYFLSC